MDNLNDLLTTQQFAEESLTLVAFNLFLCILLVSFVGWFYKKYSRSLGGKTHVGSILPLIGLTVFMVITVVKSSLALSLGLVGALSIVRFRTPIKEPEELGYLFLTIAIGLGFGAGFQIITVLITLSILMYLYLTKSHNDSSRIDGEYTLILTLKEDSLKKVSKIFEDDLLAFKLIRVETDQEKVNAYYNISIPAYADLEQLISKFKKVDSSIKFNLIESGVNW